MKAEEKLDKMGNLKDSGAEWLGRIPQNWDCIRMKHLFKDVSIKNKPDAELLSVTQDQGVVPRTWVENRMVMPSGALASFKFIQQGNFAISLRSFEGGLEYCHHDGIISPAYTVLKAQKDFHLNYYKYLFKSSAFISELQTSVVGIREGKNISYPELSYSFIPVPPKTEQAAIANFLDKKIALIDKAIAIKEKQIELLKERRQILIHRAVTRGLNPNVKMKDCGVEWIGEVPDHWEVKKLKFVCAINQNSLPETTNKDFSFEYVDIGSVDYESGIFKTEVFSFNEAPSRARRIAKLGDTIISTVRTYLKAIDIIDNNKNGFVYSTGFSIIQPPKTMEPEFVLHFIKSDAFTEQVSVNSKGMSYPAINSTELINLYILIPPIAEQKSIVSFVNGEIKKYSELIKNQASQNRKLIEFKETLINSFVTGKIKV